MGLIFSASTFAGVGASKLLLMAGMGQVLIRYPLAVIFSYLIFLGLTRLWVFWVLASPIALSAAVKRKDGSLSLNLGDGDWNFSSGGGSGGSGFSGFGGGSSGGGGASDSWGTAEVQPLQTSSSGGGSWFDFDFSLDDDSIWVVILLIVLVGSILGSGLYLIYIAPHLLPDLAVNALLASSFAQAARKADEEGWVKSAVKATWIPFVVVLVLASALGWAVHHACPVAERLLDVFSCPV